MIRLFVQGGPYMYVLALLAVVVVGLSVRKAIDLFVRSGLEGERLERGLDAILFWGSISAVLGFLGQFSGAYLSLMIIMRAQAVNPALVAEGVAVSLIPTIAGLAVLAFSTVVWFGLRWRLRCVAVSRR